MKASCLQENLAAGLAIAGRAAARRATLPALEYILVEAMEDHALMLSANNMELGIRREIAAKVERPGRVAVPANTLTDVVRSFLPDRVDLEADGERHKLALRCSDCTVTINGLDPEEMPNVPPMPDDAVRAAVEPDLLQEAIKQVAFSASDDTDRPVLSGVLVRFGDQHITMVSADGFRLSRKTVQASTGKAASAIVPARALNELAKVIHDDDEHVVIGMSGTKVWFETEGLRLVSQIVQGEFPDYNQIIPSAYATRTAVSTAAFRRLLETAQVFARDSAQIVRLGIGSNTLAVSAANAETGDAWGQIDADVEGVEIEIAFSVKYMLEMTKIVGVPQISIETMTSSSPGVIRTPGDSSYLHVMMPMHLQPRLT